jgi:hypothetical protein
MEVIGRPRVQPHVELRVPAPVTEIWLFFWSAVAPAAGVWKDDSINLSQAA